MINSGLPIGSPLFSCKLFKKGSLEKILTLEKAN